MPEGKWTKSLELYSRFTTRVTEAEAPQEAAGEARICSIKAPLPYSLVALEQESIAIHQIRFSHDCTPRTSGPLRSALSKRKATDFEHHTNASHRMTRQHCSRDHCSEHSAKSQSPEKTGLILVRIQQDNYRPHPANNRSFSCMEPTTEAFPAWSLASQRNSALCLKMVS